MQDEDLKKQSTIKYYHDLNCSKDVQKRELVMMLIKYLLIIFSLLSLISCVSESPYEDVQFNDVFFTFKNNTTENISYKTSIIRCDIKLNNTGTELEGVPKCDIYKGTNYNFTNPEYWDTNIPSIDVATLQPSESIISYGGYGDTNRDGGYPGYFYSFILTVTIDNVSKKIVGFNEELYRKLFYDKPPEFFENILSYGAFYGANLSKVIPTDFEYNPCWTGAHTALTDYSKLSTMARYYLDISINSINDIEITLDKVKSKIGNSGYDKATDTCKFYIDENIRSNKGYLLSFFPFTHKEYDNIPKDLTGRIYISTEPGIGDKIIGYGSDPE